MNANNVIKKEDTNSGIEWSVLNMEIWNRFKESKQRLDTLVLQIRTHVIILNVEKLEANINKTIKLYKYREIKNNLLLDFDADGELELDKSHLAEALSTTDDHGFEWSEEMEHALSTLTDKQRKVINLMFVEKYTQSEVARKFGITSAGVKKHYDIAIKNLKAVLSEKNRKKIEKNKKFLGAGLKNRPFFLPVI